LKLTSTVLALLALAAGLVIAGCGDDDDETTSGTTTTEATDSTDTGAEAPTKADFIKEADSICAEADQALADSALEQYPEGPPTGDDAVAFAEDVFIPNLQGQHDDLAALTPPEGEEDAFADLLEQLQTGIDEVAQDPESFVETDALEDAAAAASDFGFRSCGQQ
jgi:hypothetical protein